MKVSKKWTKARLADEVFELGQKLDSARTTLAKRDHEVWILRDLLVTLYNDRER